MYLHMHGCNKMAYATKPMESVKFVNSTDSIGFVV